MRIKMSGDGWEERGEGRGRGEGRRMCVQWDSTWHVPAKPRKRSISCRSFPRVDPSATSLTCTISYARRCTISPPSIEPTISLPPTETRVSFVRGEGTRSHSLPSAISSKFSLSLPLFVKRNGWIKCHEMALAIACFVHNELITVDVTYVSTTNSRIRRIWLLYEYVIVYENYRDFRCGSRMKSSYETSKFSAYSIHRCIIDPRSDRNAIS
jgi:hypothetical protein